MIGLFKDTERHWASADIERAVRLGLIRGYPDGTFKPDQHITRAETATISLRLYDRTKEMYDDLVAAVEPAVVTVTNLKTGALGSGTSIGRGFVLTNAHVVLDREGQTVARYGIYWTDWAYSGDAKYAEADCVAVFPEVDLAIIRVLIAQYRDKMPSLPLGDPNEVRRGMPVLVVGAPVGLAGSVSQGIVSYVGRRLEYRLESGTSVVIEDAIQTDAPINPGNSGGALVDRKGQLIGVPSCKLVDLALEGLGFCIGLQTVTAAIRRAEESGALAVAHKSDLVAVVRAGGLELA